MVKQQNKIIRALIVILALAGIIVMGYLLYVHYSSDEGKFCDFGEGLSCDVVNKSIYAEILGIPLSLLGLFYFVVIFILGVFKYKKDWLKKALFISLVFLGPSLYLSFIEFFVLKNICVFCELSKVLIVALIIIFMIAVRPTKLGIKFYALALVLAVLSVLGTYFIQSNVSGIPEGKYNEFAQCLNEKNVKMYGSVTCAFCERERAMFGTAFEFIEEIECDPRNANSEAERCIAKDVERTPTWIMEDAEGNDIYRFNTGVVPLVKLAEVSGCKLPN